MPHNLTSHDPVSQSVERTGGGGSGPTAKERCEAKGENWSWDEVQKICVLKESRLPSPQKITETTDKLIEGVVSRLPSPFSRGEPTPDTRKEACELQGGVWENGVCIPKPQVEERELIGGIDRGTGSALDLQIQGQAAGDQDLESGTIVTGEDGNITGFINSEGQFVRDRETALAIREKTLKEEQLLAGVQTAEQQLGTRRERQKLQQALLGIGQIGELTDAEQADINYSQAVAAGLAGIIPSALGGAALGATAGLVGSAGVLSIPGALAVGGAGAVGSFFSGVLGNIKVQQDGELGAASEELTLATFSMRQYAMLATQDPAMADFYIGEYNTALTRAYQAQRQVQAEVQGDFNSWIEDGRVDLAKFDTFLRPGGKADVYGEKLRVALLKGVPLQIIGEDLEFAESIK
jgi:hypothetical protein